MAVVSGHKPLPTHHADLTIPPEWVGRLFGPPAAELIPRGHSVHNHESGDLVFISVRAVGVKRLCEPEFSAAVTDTYQRLFASLRDGPAAHPVRFWNHIPGLHDSVAPSLDRYMAFNAGRFAAMQEWFGDVDRTRRSVATASGIGHRGDDLLIHCLATREPGTAVENPRQVPAYLYSNHYGPTPPCFSRATIATIRGQRLLLIAGTASIRGEQSVHIGDLPAQINETLINLSAVIGAVAGGTQSESLARLLDVRVYHPQTTDEPAIRGAAQGAFSGAREIEVQRADLCRADLLVEIEGVALV